MQSDNIKKLFLKKYSSIGEEKFYKFLIDYALNRINDVPGKNNYNPAIELMEYYDMFLKLYRREGEQVYSDLARQFRRAGHTVYRTLLKKGIGDKNLKFLNIVK